MGSLQRGASVWVGDTGVSSTVSSLPFRPPTAISRAPLGTHVTTWVGEMGAGTLDVTWVPARVAEIALRGGWCHTAMKSNRKAHGVHFNTTIGINPHDLTATTRGSTSHGGARVCN